MLPLHDKAAEVVRSPSANLLSLISSNFVRRRSSRWQPDRLAASRFGCTPHGHQTAVTGGDSVMTLHWSSGPASAMRLSASHIRPWSRQRTE
jgi:hypothetical protein